MIKWEYIQTSRPEGIADVSYLNLMGEEGWEVCTVEQVVHIKPGESWSSRDIRTRYTFKRSKRD